MPYAPTPRKHDGGSAVPPDPLDPIRAAEPSSCPDSLRDVPDLIPARMLNELVYCPRLFYLEFVQAQFADNPDTIEGRRRHKRVDEPAGKPPQPSDKQPSDDDQPLEASAEQPAGDPEPQVARSVWLSAPRLGLTAVVDLLEADGTQVTPVDYKRGRAPDGEPNGAWDADRAQLAAQALVLRENGYTCNEGVVYYASSRRRVIVPIDDELVRWTLELRERARQIALEGCLPPPLIDSPKCPRCSLVGICLPDEVQVLRDLESGQPPSTEPRRLLPARQDALPVYVQAQGGSIGKTGDQIYIQAKDQPRQTLRLLDVAQINIFGNVQISTQALRELTARGVPVCYFSWGGWFQAIATGMPHKNVELRIRQYETFSNAARALDFARRLVHGKIANARTLLRRNADPRPREALRDLNDLRKRALQADSIPTLLGIEGNAGRIYFSRFADMLRPPADRHLAFDFNGRNRRPPRDPVNALLSLAYSLLVKDLTATLIGVGFDPYLGFYHRPRYGRPALALDLAEEFRPLIADSVVLQCINTGQVQPDDFIQRGPACNLTQSGRKAFISAYERRLDTLITHPIFGYTISYRRILDVQARLLAAHLVGEFPHYVPFLTR